jgi:hypothetical protein
MRTTIIMIVTLALSSGAGWAGNLLANPSLETGDKHPAGWACYGGGGQGWEVGGPEGERYVSVVGDGAGESGWYATGKGKLQPNRIYRVSLWARQEADTSGGRAEAGLTRAKWQFPVSREWERETFHFRSADLISGLRFEVGQHQVDGALDFDDIGLYPSVPVHRSRGRGRYLLGDGESVIDRHYLARTDPASPHANDYRFLYRASANYDGDRWVMDRTDMIVFLHQVEVAGALQPDPHVRGSITVSTGSNTSTGTIGGTSYSGWTDVTELTFKSDQSHLVEQEAVTVELDVPRCEGSVLVEMAPGPNGPWLPAKAIDAPGTYAISAPKGLLIPSRTIAIRLTSLAAKRVEITGYRFHSMLVQQEARDPAYGDTHYVDILHDSPVLECGLVDMGDLRTDGRDEVCLKIANRGPRRRFVMAVTVKRGSELISREEEEFALGTNGETLRAVPYRVAPEGAQTLMVTLRDAKTDELLLDLESLFVAVKGES